MRKKKNQNNIIKMRTQIKKISGEESHSSEEKKLWISRKMSEHWNGNSEKKAQL